MPPARFATLIAIVLVAAAMTVGLATLVVPWGQTTGWVMLPLIAAAASFFWRKHS